MTSNKAICELDGKTFTILMNNDRSIEVCPNVINESTKEPLRKIAAANKIDYDPSWNTRYLGYRIIKKLNNVEINEDNQLEKEYRIATQYYLEETTFKDKRVVKLNVDNVARVEAMIHYDSQYTKSSRADAYPDETWLKDLDICDIKKLADRKGYRGSTAFWMNMLRYYFFGRTKTSQKNEFNYDIFGPRNQKGYFNFIVFNAVCAVDTENSTHINADKKGRIELTERIVSIESDFISQLLDTNNYPLVKLLSQNTHPTETYKKGDKDVCYSKRNNFSFATKFCHYACLYMFEDENQKYRDLYSIYDNVVSTALNDYYDFNEVPPTLFTNIKGEEDLDYTPKYRHYQDYIKTIIDESESGISRKGFDHLLWYYYKGKGMCML